jgi:hypothetical protein
MGRLDGFPVMVVVAALLACGGAAPKPQVAADSNEVEVGKGDPPAGFEQMQTLEVKHGSGCGLYGTKGNFDGAYAMLRNEGHKVGADYVQIMTVQEPYSDGACAHQEYRMTGVAYRRGKAASKQAQSAPQEAAPARACVPGATQACLGPGACKGAQACREDGTGFEPCDCGTATEAAPGPAASASAAAGPVASGAPAAAVSAPKAAAR